jgi:hypothetical protein
MSENAEIDHSEALREARSKNAQMPNAQQSHPGDLHIPQHESDGVQSQYSFDGDHADNLDTARKNSSTLSIEQSAKDIAESATPMGAVSLFKQIDIMSDMPYIAALGAALLKDLLDLVAAPTVVLSILFSILCSIFIFMMLMLVDANGKRKGAKKFLGKIGTLLLGGIADSIPGIDFLPIESLTVAVIYYLTLVERKNAKE